MNSKTLNFIKYSLFTITFSPSNIIATSAPSYISSARQNSFTNQEEIINILKNISSYNPSSSTSRNIVPSDPLELLSRLNYAIYRNDSNTIQILMNKLNSFPIEKKWELINTKSNGYTIFHTAALSGNMNVIKELIKVSNAFFTPKTWDLIINKDSNGCTAFQLAALNGQIDVIKEFIKITNSFFTPKTWELITMKDNNGCTPFHSAALNGHIEVVKEFIRIANSFFSPKGWELITMKDNNGYNAFHLAAFNGHTETLKEFIKIANSFFTSKFWELVSLQDNSGNTALHLAVKQGQLDALKTIIECAGSRKEALAAIKNKTGLTALDLA